MRPYRPLILLSVKILRSSYRTQSVTSLSRRQAPSSSSQPKLRDPRKIPQGRRLATLVTQTRGVMRLSLPGLLVRNLVLGRRESAQRIAVTSLFMC